MNLSDFSGGIVEDVGSEDAGPNTLSDSVNMDHWPGVSRRRNGTDMVFVTEYTYDRVTRVHTQVGQIPASGEEIVQIEEVRAPDARAGSIKGFTTANTFNGTPEEHCLNTNVTVILVSVGGTAYKCFADPYEKDKFVRVANFDAADDSVPYMIVHQSCVDIGNVLTSTGERGVLWLGHIKGLYCWTREQNALGNQEYGYLNWIDEWRLSDSECFDSLDEVKWMLYVSNVEASWNNSSPAALDFFARYGIDYAQAMKELVSPFQIGATPTNFKIKVTAVYDGFQESRPLPYVNSVQYNELAYDNASQEILLGSATLPDNWEIRADPERSSFAEISLRPVTRATTWAHTFSDPVGPSFTDGAVVDDLTGNGLYWYLKVQWLREYFEGGDPDETGEGFLLEFSFSTSETGNAGEGAMKWTFDGVRRLGLRLYPKLSIDGKVNGVNQGWGLVMKPTLAWFLFLLGARAEFPAADVDAYYTQGLLQYITDPNLKNTIAQNWQTLFPTLAHERNIVAQMMIVTETDFYADPVYPTWNSLVNYDNAFFHTPLLDFDKSVLGIEFGLDAYAGRGVLGILPFFPDSPIVEPSGSTLASLQHGARRLTGFRIYIMEEDVDIDFTLRKEIFFDKNPSDPNHYGGAEQFGVRQSFRDGPGRDAPVWKRQAWGLFGPPIYLIHPYYERKFVPMSTFTGLSFKGGLHEDFIISDNVLTDRAGNSTLSGNLQRPENERDAPVWIRGAVCEGRTFGIRYTDRLIQYSVVGGGVPQHNIMPQSAISVARDELPQHIVSWRGVFHMVFTDKGLHRFDLADGDEMHWRILDTFANHGTVLWRGICNTPQGLYYVTSDGIFSYAGNDPQNVTWGFWQNRFRTEYASSLAENNTFTGYNSRDGRVFFALDAKEQNEFNVWVLDLRLKAWWKYRFRGWQNDYVSPRYMRMWDGRFFLSFGAQDTRFLSPSSFADVAPDGYGYCAYMITNDIEPGSQTDLAFQQYIGFKYLAKDSLRYKLAYGPYLDEPRQLWFPYRNLKGVKLPGSRDNFSQPLPSGISRMMRIMVGQGDVFFDHLGNPDANSKKDLQVRLISLRGRGEEQFNA